MRVLPLGFHSLNSGIRAEHAILLRRKDGRNETCCKPRRLGDFIAPVLILRCPFVWTASHALGFLLVRPTDLRIDFRLVRSTVDEEMIKMAEARKRRADEETYRNLYRELERQYNRLKSQNSKDKIIPTLAQFRQLPVIKLVQSQQTPASTDVSRDLKSGLLAGMLEGDLDKWSKTAKEAFGEMLGFPGYRSASKTKLHPVDRITARFRCKRCRKEGWKYAQDGCLDFPGVCAHVCHDSSMEKRTKERWNPDHFEADEKVRGLLVSA